MKRILLFFALVLSICTLCVSIVYAGDNVLLSTSGFEAQEKSNWCWVASARNSVHYETNNHRTQKAAVLHLKGSVLGEWYPNVFGNISDIEDAAEYISKDNESYTGANVTGTFLFLKGQIDYRNITIACAGYYNNNVRNSGHAVVITGYHTLAGKNHIVYHDPLDNQTYVCLYSQFCDGSYNERIYDQTCYNNETS